MGYATDGALPKDVYGSPSQGVYVPNVGTVAQQGGAAQTDAQGQVYAPEIISQGASQIASATLQNAAGANGNGAILNVAGMAVAIFVVNQAAFTGTVTFQGSADGTNFDPLNATQLGTSTITTSVTGSTTTSVHLYEVNCAGLAQLRAPVSGFSAGTVTVSAYAAPVAFPARVVNVNAVSAYPSGATAITADSGNQANANAVATLAAVSGKTTYITGFACTASGATAALVVTVSVAGVVTGTLHFTFVAPAGVTAQATPLIVQFPEPLPASAPNTAIVVTLPALGTGNTNATATAYGFQM